jgi:hypothetical protein
VVSGTNKHAIRYESARVLRLLKRRSAGHCEAWRVMLGVPTLVLAVSLAVGNWGSSAQAQTPSEYEMKAVFLYNFAQFVEWPPEPSGMPDPGFVICVVGQDPFGESLDGAVSGKFINSRSVTLRRIRRASEAKACQIAFISSSERRHLRPLLDSLDGARVLTVGDTEGFGEQGGMINFTLEESRVRFEINVEATQRVGLKLSSKLLALAVIVRSPGSRRKR